MTQAAAELTLTLNGKSLAVRDAQPHTTLLEWLRARGYVGSKEGCAEGECGACAVLLVQAGEDGKARYVAANGCLLLLGALDGQEVVTVEGLGAPGALHPAQAALARAGGSQCGYCTPGFAVSMAAEYYREDRAAFDLEALSGNLCRCTGYRPIRDAAESLESPPEHDPLARRLGEAAPPARPTVLRTPEGELRRPATLAEALALLARFPAAKLLAGGTDWGVEVNLGHARAPLVVAIDHLPELRGLDFGQGPEGAYVEIGAALPLSEIERRLHGRVPLLGEWFALFASRLIRNRATLGGNLGTASPIGDAAPALLALNARLVLASVAGAREVPLEEFFVGYRETVLRGGELIRALRLPLPQPQHARFYKVAKRRTDDISGVAAAFALDLEGDTVRTIRIGLGGVAATPIRARSVEARLTGARWDGRTVREAARLMAGEGTPLDDHRASAAYRRAMLEQLLLKFRAETAPEVHS